jgi:3,4-dihydroxy-2-butanone 4-phosphate synthase
VPAEVAGTALASFHSDAANGERAEFWVHTDTTRPADRDAATGCSSAERSRTAEAVAREAAGSSWRRPGGGEPELPPLLADLNALGSLMRNVWSARWRAWASPP